MLVLTALAVPRVLMAFALLLTDWFGRAFETRLWPIPGFVLFYAWDEVDEGGWLVPDQGHAAGAALAAAVRRSGE